MNTSCGIDREALLNEIRALNFSIIELNLYLNTHPCDRNALNIYNCYVQRYLVLLDRYQKMFGPILMGTFQSSCPWQWVEGEWPWEL